MHPVLTLKERMDEARCALRENCTADWFVAHDTVINCTRGVFETSAEGFAVPRCNNITRT
jgi:hypothetical protein